MYRLIIADDEEPVLNQLSQGVDWEKYGFQLCGTANSGTEALALINSIRPHLLITDVRMDDMDGLSVLAKVSQEFPETRVIIFSAYNLFEYAQKAILYSAIAYLTKPLNLKQLEEALHKVTQNLHDGNQNDTSENAVDMARAYMREHFAEKITLEHVAEICFVHPSHLSRLFRTKYNTTFSSYLTELRIKQAAHLLLMTDMRIPKVAEMTGYDDYSYFCRVFHKTLGVTPLEYRCHGSGDKR